MRNEINTRSGKRKFVKDLCKAVRDDVLRQVEKMPPHWDGHELRVYLAEHFQESANMSALNRDQQRRKDYRNTVYSKGM